ncbi:MAG: hypothetical protein K8F24_11315, partial [Bacteroidales bacterium]|nr:hypothetical protein [Bacteroidales bacterium]
MEENIKKIIWTLDEELIKNGKTYLTLAQANKCLMRSGIFTVNDIAENAFKKILEKGKIPNAEQTEKKPRQWLIFHSNDKVKKKIDKKESVQKKTERITTPNQITHNIPYRNTVDIQGGCVSTAGFSMAAIGIGTFLSFTGIGAIIGVPIILAAIILPFKNIGNTMIQGPCPY